MTEAFPVLYILMRTDLKSMNSGKAMAQASHASNAFIYSIKNKKAKLCSEDHDGEMEEHRANIGLADIWEMQTAQGFGTVLVLSVTEVQMNTAVEVAKALGFEADRILDPTYPILVPNELGNYITDNMLDLKDLVVGNGGGYVTIPVNTCAYIFGDKNDPLLAAVVGNFSLHP